MKKRTKELIEVVTGIGTLLLMGAIGLILIMYVATTLENMMIAETTLSYYEGIGR